MIKSPKSVHPRVGLLLCLAAAGVSWAGSGSDASGRLGEAKAAYQSGDHKKALGLFLPLAESGDHKAQALVGMMYAKGEGAERDEKAAAEWLAKSAAQGNAGAMYMLGTMYAKGQGLQKDLALAARWLERAAEKNHVDASYLCGMMYLNGQGVGQNLFKAETWLTKAAEKGNPSAQYQLGFMYERGKGVLQDDEQAMSWYARAAKGGLAAAGERLAALRVKAEAEKARENEQAGGPSAEGRTLGAADQYAPLQELRQKAGAGDSEAQWALGRLYFLGEKPVSPNAPEAAAWLRKASASGLPRAQAALGMMYLTGRGVGRSRAEAEKWLKEASGKGDPHAHLALGYLQLKSAEPDAQVMLQWFKKAEAAGCPLAPAAHKKAMKILMAGRMDLEETVEYLAGKVVVGALSAGASYGGRGGDRHMQRVSERGRQAQRNYDAAKGAELIQKQMLVLQSDAEMNSLPEKLLGYVWE